MRTSRLSVLSSKVAMHVRPPVPELVCASSLVWTRWAKGRRELGLEAERLLPTASRSHQPRVDRGLQREIRLARPRLLVDGPRAIVVE
jgi:hypothetical protein